MAQARVTRQTLEVLGSNIGTVRARDVGTLYPPFIRNDWSEPVAVTTSWATDLTRAKSNLAEDAKSLRTRPTLSVSARTLGTDLSESFEQVLARSRATQSLAPMPLYSDRSEITAPVGGGRVIPCDTFYRRFYPGQRVALTSGEFDRVSIGGNFGHVEYGIVSEVTSRGLVLEDTTLGPWRAQDWVYPMLDCLPVLESSGSLLTDYYAEADIEFVEEGGQSAMPPTWRGYPEHLYSFHEGLPVVYFNEWNEEPRLSVVRPGRIAPSGKGQIADADGDRPLLQWEFSVLSTTRREAWELLQLFDGCRGRGRQFWLVNPLTIFEVVGQSSTFVTISQVDYRQVLEEGWITHIAIQLSDGRNLVRPIESVTEIGSSWRINFSEPYTPGGATPIRVTSAHRVRFSEDSLTQNWITDEVVETPVSMTETRNSDSNVSIANLPDLLVNL